jgi:hypothetical protein
MSPLKVIALVMALLSGLTMLGTAHAIQHQFKVDPSIATTGAKVALWIHLFWSVTVTVLAAAVVYG